MKAKWKMILALSLVAVLVALLAYRMFFYAPPVAVIHAEEGKVALEVRGPGVVASRIQVTVSTRVTGILKALHADQGDSVKAGQLLALLDDTDSAAKAGGAAAASVASQRNIAAADAALAKARADRELAQGNYRRDQEVFRAGYISQAAMDVATATLKSAQSAEASAAATLGARQAESQASAQEAVYARALHTFTRITAPMAGLIVVRDAEVGDTVVPGSPIFRMVDTRTLWVAARIDESVVGQVEVGQPATIRLRSGKEVPGEVARINRQSDAATRELEVDVAFREIPERFAIDQEAAVVIHAGEEKGVVIPASALFQQGRAFGVLVAANGRAGFRPVRTGATDGERVIVREGLKADETVIRQPAGIRAGSRVRPVAEGNR
ncbi:MAG: efflux RND transporter periplasmic adaptor subunit [Thiobacillus sp.]|nr:efflux RND transporter periplasmic adaptor subunit [Thiobacillus sp.]